MMDDFSKEEQELIIQRRNAKTKEERIEIVKKLIELQKAMANKEKND